MEPAHTGFTANFVLSAILKSEVFSTCRHRNPLDHFPLHQKLCPAKGSNRLCLFNEDLYHLLINSHNREVLKQTVLSAYLPSVHKVSANNEFITTIIYQILHEPAAAYKTKAASFDEDEVFIRGGVFKKEIPKIYNYTCCISGMRIIADKEVQMIDACHIVPFSESGDDTIRNGLSLCPNLHRAFDRGLIAISDDYRVLVKPFYEADQNVYSIKQFEGKEIFLPKEKVYHPLKENLSKHRIRFHFQ